MYIEANIYLASSETPINFHCWLYERHMCTIGVEISMH